MFWFLKQAVYVLGQKYHRLSEHLASAKAAGITPDGARGQGNSARREDVNPFLRRLPFVKDGGLHCHALQVAAIHTKQIARPTSEERRMASAG